MVSGVLDVRSQADEASLHGNLALAIELYQQGMRQIIRLPCWATDDLHLQTFGGVYGNMPLFMIESDLLFMVQSGLGSLYMNLEEYEKAYEWLELSLDIIGSTRGRGSKTAHVSQKLDMNQEAIGLVEKALKTMPNQAVLKEELLRLKGGR